MVREREKRLGVSKNVQTLSRRLSEKRSKIAKATTESTGKLRQRDADSLERDLLRAESKLVDQDKAIAALGSDYRVQYSFNTAEVREWATRHG